jgi:hypothetical protein
MAHALVIEERGSRTTFPLAGPATAGGSAVDPVRLPGLPPTALRLEPCAAGVVLTPTVTGLRVGRHPVLPGRRRLLRPGERARLGAVAIGIDGSSPQGTRAAAGALLVGPAQAGLSLLVLSGPAAGARVLLHTAVVLGRGRGAGLRLPDAQVSRRHARVSSRAGRAVVEDLGSKNGIRVNGVRVDRRPVELGWGDELALGETALALAACSLVEETPARSGSLGPAGRSRSLTAAALLFAVTAAALLLAAR